MSEYFRRLIRQTGIKTIPQGQAHPPILTSDLKRKIAPSESPLLEIHESRHVSKHVPYGQPGQEMQSDEGQNLLPAEQSQAVDIRTANNDERVSDSDPLEQSVKAERAQPAQPIENQRPRKDHESADQIYVEINPFEDDKTIEPAPSHAPIPARDTTDVSPADLEFSETLDFIDIAIPVSIEPDPIGSLVADSSRESDSESEQAAISSASTMPLDKDVTIQQASQFQLPNVPAEGEKQIWADVYTQVRDWVSKTSDSEEIPELRNGDAQMVGTEERTKDVIGLPFQEINQVIARPAQAVVTQNQSNDEPEEVLLSIGSINLTIEEPPKTAAPPAPAPPPKRQPSSVPRHSRLSRYYLRNR